MVKIEVFTAEPPCPGCLKLLELADEIQKERHRTFRKPTKSPSKSILRMLLPMTAVAACLLLLVFVNSLGIFKQDVVYAMEKAVAKLNNYHGILEMRTRNAAGEEWLVRWRAGAP